MTKFSIPAQYLGTCPGSGADVRPEDAWNVRNANEAWHKSAEGWRTRCPACAKISGVGPTSKKVQQHSTKAPKLTAQERLDLLYEDTYTKAAAGESLRPNPNWPKKDIEVWLMAYLDGRGDAPYNGTASSDRRVIGALKRWMKANGLGTYTLDF